MTMAATIRRTRPLRERDTDRSLVEALRLVAEGHSEHAASVIVARGFYPHERFADRRIRRRIFQLRNKHESKP